MPKKILVVDDEQSIVRSVKSNLERVGYQVVTATGGVKGWSAVQEELPDLLIVNDVMSDMDGFQIVRNMKEDEKLRDIPVMMLLDDGSDEQLFRGWQTGCDCVVNKRGLNILEVLSFVKRILTPIERME